MEETVWWTLRKRKIVAADECNKVELPALEQLQALGWDYLHGSALAPGFSCSGNVRPWPRLCENYFELFAGGVALHYSSG